MKKKNRVRMLSIKIQFIISALPVCPMNVVVAIIQGEPIKLLPPSGKKAPTDGSHSACKCSRIDWPAADN